MMKKYNHFTPTRLERIKMPDEKVCLLERIWNNDNSYKLLMVEGTDTITLMIFSNVEYATHYYQALPSTYVPRKT